MKKITKKNIFIILISAAVFVGFISFNNYKKPIEVHKVFNNAVTRKPSSNDGLKKSTIEINAKLYRGKYRGSILNFTARLTNELEGQIIIDNKEYYFNGFTGKSELINIIGSVYEKNDNTQALFMVRMKDLDSIELLGVGTNDYKITAET